MRGGHGLRDLADELVGVVGLQGAGSEQRGDFSRVGQPFVHDIDEIVLLDGIQDLHEARVAEKGRGPGGREDGTCPGVISGKQMHTDSAPELLVDRTPTAETVQTGDALLQPVASGEFVPAVELGRCCGLRRLLLALLVPGAFTGRGISRFLRFHRAVGRGLVRLGGQRLVATVVGHVDGSRATFRHRRSCLPIRCALSASLQSHANCAHSPALCTTHGVGRWLCDPVGA